jgi:hypothetical protein
VGVQEAKTSGCANVDMVRTGKARELHYRRMRYSVAHVALPMLAGIVRRKAEPLLNGVVPAARKCVHLHLGDSKRLLAHPR